MLNGPLNHLSLKACSDDWGYFFFWVSDTRVHKVSKPNSLAELLLNVLSNVGWKPRANEAVVEQDLSLGSKLKTDQFMFV